MARVRTKPALIINGPGHFADQVRAAGLGCGVDTVFRDIGEIAVTISPGEVRIYETVEGRDIADFGLVQVVAYPRPTAALLTTIADYLRIRGIHGVNVAGIGVPTKLFTYARLAHHGVQVPETAYLPPRILTESFHLLSEWLDTPFVLTPAVGGSGGTIVAGSPQALDQAGHPGWREDRLAMLAQEFVPAECSYRALVLGGQVPVVTKHMGGNLCAQDNDPSRVTARIAADDLDPVAARLAAHAAEILGYDVAAVDVVRHWTTDIWYVLGVNPNPSIGTGEYADDNAMAYSAYLKRRLGSG